MWLRAAGAPEVDAKRGLHFSQTDVSGLGIQVRPAATPVQWRLTMGRDGGDVKAEVEDVILVLAYHWE